MRLLLSIPIVAGFLLFSSSIAQQIDRHMPAYRRAAARPNTAGFSETTFSGDEDDFIRANKRETAEALASYLRSKSVHQVLRRCVELRLPCGDAAPRPARGSEPWRTSSRRQQQQQP